MTGDPPPRPAERFDEVFDLYFAEIHRYAAKRLGPDAAGRLGPGRNAEEHTERVDSRVSAEGLRGELAGAIAELPRGQRDVLLRVALADLSHEEVAALGISYGTVGSQLNRARTTLRIQGQSYVMRPKTGT